MSVTINLTNGKFYHIYNRANNENNIFHSENDYRHFLSLYSKHIEPIADTFAWVLMPNHFHFLVRIKENVRYKYQKSDFKITPNDFELFKWETIAIDESDLIHPKAPIPYRHFSNLFNAYSKYRNTSTESHGSVFDLQFKRKEISNTTYLKNVLIYIHQNPVHHGFCSHPIEYPWSSYLSCISLKTTKIKRDEILGWFDNEANFIQQNESKIDLKQIEKYLDF